ncbi:MAG TPA: nucleotide exchange factor GrpE [Bacteroidetes bacterium]|nr:nucleotide exchange factor GrpE [Bacteroidota bacterium]
MKKKDTKHSTEQVLDPEILNEDMKPENDQNVSETVGVLSDETSEEELRIAELESTIESLKSELEISKDTLLRRTAEFENVKKRMMRERIQLLDDAKIEAVKAFLPVNDDMQRSLGAATDQEIPKAFLEGVNLVAEKFNHVLNTYGVEMINESGVPFDVNIHDAMLKTPSNDPSIQSDTVLQVLEAGYKIGDKVIRHAKVIVSE